MLGTARDDSGAPLPGDAPLANNAPYVYVADLEAHYTRASTVGAEIVQPLETKGYGGAGYSARDIEGNVWSFGTYTPSLEPVTHAEASR